MATEQEILRLLEKRLNNEYRDTEKAIKGKIAVLTASFDNTNKLYLQQLKDGKIDEKAYKKWYKKQVTTAKWCNDMLSELSKDVTQTNVKASEIMNGSTPDMFIQGCLDGSVELEKSAKEYPNFDLIDRKQAEILLKDNRDLLPKAKVNIPKDEQWNKRRMRSAVLQSAIKGESIPKLSKRLENVVGMNRTSAIRNARTMMTGSHNLGKLETGYEALEMGINVKKEWIATEDGRTRISHRILDGEVVEMDKPFSNDLMYPADPDGEPKEVYNCRCALGYVVDDPYDKELKGTNQTEGDKFKMVDGEDITDTWERRPDEFDFEIDDVINAQGFDGVPRVVDADEFDKYVKESNIIATRGYKAPDQETLDAYRDQLYNGKWYVDCSTGGAMFGRGMYTAGNRSTFLSEESVRVGQSYGESIFGNVEILTFDKSIKTINSKDIYYERKKLPYEYFSKKIKDEGITLSEVQKDMARMRFGDTNANPWDKYSPEEMKEAHDSLKGLFEKYAEDAFAYMDSFSKDDGVFCALRGYDAIEVDVDSKENKYFVVLNRTKVIIRRS